MLYKTLEKEPLHNKDDSFTIPLVLFVFGVIAMIIFTKYAADTLSSSHNLFATLFNGSHN